MGCGEKEKALALLSKIEDDDSKIMTSVADNRKELQEDATIEVQRDNIDKEAFGRAPRPASNDDDHNDDDNSDEQNEESEHVPEI
jgi:hypothetical protein